MSKLAETLDEAVARIARAAIDGVPQHLDACRCSYCQTCAAICQGIAWAYRDAAREADSDERVPRQLVNILKRKAEEVTRG